MTTTFDPTKPVQTRDGRKARIVATDLKSGSGETILACVFSTDDEHEYTMRYFSNGTFWDDGPASADDLINVPEEKVCFINVTNPGGGKVLDVYRHFDINGAKNSLYQGSIGILKLTVTGDKITAEAV